MATKKGDKIRVLISCASEPSISTIVDATVDGISTSGELRKAICRAVTNWINRTEDGKTAFNASCHDFNIGDLAHLVGCPVLNKFLRAEGIQKLDVECSSETSDPNWDHDDVLFMGDEKKSMPQAL